MATADNNNLYTGGLNDAYGSRDSAGGSISVNDLYGTIHNSIYADDSNDAYGDS